MNGIDIETVVATAGEFAADVDATNRFPAETLAAIRKAGLLAVGIPQKLGGAGRSPQTQFEFCSAVGEQCMSSALILAMHYSQVALLVREGGEFACEILSRAAEEGLLLASITSESETGTDLLRSASQLRAHPSPGQLLLDRHTPHVSYLDHADAVVVKMQAPGDPRSLTDVVHVALWTENADLTLGVVHPTSGVRGTQTRSARLTSVVSERQLLQISPDVAANRCITPYAYLGWVGAWHGCASYAFRQAFRVLRANPTSSARHLGSSQTRAALLELHLQITGTRNRASAFAMRLAQDESVADGRLSLEMLELKLAASRACIQVVDGACELAGLTSGYINSEKSALERMRRDIASSAFMVNNHEIIVTAGLLVVGAHMGLGR